MRSPAPLHNEETRPTNDQSPCLTRLAGEPASFSALQPSVVLALGGESVGPCFMEWNFVSSSKDRIEQAKADWRAGRMKLPDADDAEFIPLAQDPTPPANPMS